MTKILWAVAALAILATACGNDPGPNASDQRTRATASTLGSTTLSPAQPVPDDGGEVPHESAAPEPASVQPTSGTDPTPGLDRGSGDAAPHDPPPTAPSAPAVPGTYRYDTDGTTQVSNGPARPLPKTTSLTIHPSEGDRQRSTRDLRDQDGVGGVTEQILRYAPEGVQLAYLKFETSLAGVTNTYEFTPPDPVLVVQTAAMPGDTASFTLEGDGVRIDTTATVLRTEDVNVSGTAVTTLVVEIKSTLSGEVQGEQRAVSWIDSSRSLTVKEDVETDVTQGAVRVRSKYLANVGSLEPS